MKHENCVVCGVMFNMMPRLSGICMKLFMEKLSGLRLHKLNYVILGYTN